MEKGFEAKFPGFIEKKMSLKGPYPLWHYQSPIEYITSLMRTMINLFFKSDYVERLYYLPELGHLFMEEKWSKILFLNATCKDYYYIIPYGDL